MHLNKQLRAICILEKVCAHVDDHEQAKGASCTSRLIMTFRIIASGASNWLLYMNSKCAMHLVKTASTSQSCYEITPRVLMLDGHTQCLLKVCLLNQ